MHSFSGRKLTRQLPTHLPPGVRMHSLAGYKLKMASFVGTIFYLLGFPALQILDNIARLRTKVKFVFLKKIIFS